jgi:folate-dependent phosphoribosylglycinamide formyltransferase PurN
LLNKLYDVMPFERIILLAGKWDTTPIVYQYLKSNYRVNAAIIEEGVARKDFLRRRAKKLGWVNVVGQVLFQLIIAKSMRYFSKRRIAQIKTEYQLIDTALPVKDIHHVPSVNDGNTLELLQKINPDLVIVHGTRIISRKVLQATNALFVNIHAGITPRYRGSHGAYWALANNDCKNCGVTVHFVDSGIDTGKVLAQAPIAVTSNDNFVTYPYLQLAKGLGLLKETILKLEKGETTELKNELDSGLWHHPTLWGYLWTRLTKGVR